MGRIISFFLSTTLAGCAVLQSTTQGPVCPEAQIPDTAWMPARPLVVDTVPGPTTVKTEIRVVNSDPTVRVINLAPVDGDSWQELQDAVNYCISNPGWKIKLSRTAVYHISKPIIAARAVNGDYQQVSIDIEGPTDARDAPSASTARIVPYFANAPAIIIQKGKTCHIANLAFEGAYVLPRGLSPTQIDVYGWQDWSDGSASDGRTNPYAAIAIDPFSDSTFFDGVTYKMYDGLHSHYLPRMSRGGSTDIKITGCTIQNFVVGIVISPSWQFNGELVDIENVRVDYCRAGIAWTQAQSKTNYIKNFMCWGNVHTIFDGVDFGYWRGDGATAPFIDGANIAGINYQLIQAYSYTFPISISRVYAEGLFKIGVAGGFAGTHFSDCQFDLQNGSAGVPSPDFYYEGDRTRWSSCMLRLYGYPKYRIILNSPMNVFEGGNMGLPPLCVNGLGDRPIFRDVLMFYGKTTLNSNSYDTVFQVARASYG